MFLGVTFCWVLRTKFKLLVCNLVNDNKAAGDHNVICYISGFALKSICQVEY